jgi:hypothetical protein
MATIKVDDNHRTNELSLVPGGSEVKVKMANGNFIIYDKIKHLESYCNKLMKRPEVVEIWIEDTLKWKR